MIALLDTHYHYDFLPPEARGPLLDRLAEAGVDLVAQTVTPSGFVRLEANETERLGMRDSDRAEDAAAPLQSVGFHPWYIGADADAELELFEDALARTRFIGEIGLDFAPRRIAEVPASRQLEVLRRILEATRKAATEQPYILSIHTVRAATDMLDLLRDCRIDIAEVVPVFHRFGGTSDELTRLVRAGGYISVGTQMLGSKRGRAYVTQVPADRLLLETDLPTSSDAAAESDPADDVVSALHETVRELARLRGCDAAEMRAQLLDTSARLYGAAD